MGNLSRRSFLKSTPAAMAVAGAVVAPVVVEAATISSLERYEAALAEFKAAAEAVDPNIYDWTIRTNGHLTCALLITAWRTTTKYDGDGWYAAHASNGSPTKAFVQRAPTFDKDGERWFQITLDGHKRSSWVGEKYFSIEYGRRIS